MACHSATALTSQLVEDGLGCHLAHTLLLDDRSTSCIAFIHTAIAHSHCHIHWPGMSGVVGVLQLCMCVCLSVCLSVFLSVSVSACVGVWECLDVHLLAYHVLMLECTQYLSLHSAIVLPLT